MAGGRRTAAIVAAQYLKRIPCITTVYVGSNESRSLIRISERGVSKYILLKLTNAEMESIAPRPIPFPSIRFTKIMSSTGKGDSESVFFRQPIPIPTRPVPRMMGKFGS